MSSLLSGHSYWGAALGILVLMAIFIAAVAWLFRPGANAEYRRAAQLPLDDGTKGGARKTHKGARGGKRKKG